jgi:hypothetical protein
MRRMAVRRAGCDTSSGRPAGHSAMAADRRIVSSAQTAFVRQVKIGKQGALAVGPLARFVVRVVGRFAQPPAGITAQLANQVVKDGALVGFQRFDVVVCLSRDVGWAEETKLRRRWPCCRLVDQPQQILEPLSGEGRVSNHDVERFFDHADGGVLRQAVGAKKARSLERRVGAPRVDERLVDVGAKERIRGAAPTIDRGAEENALAARGVDHARKPLQLEAAEGVEHLPHHLGHRPRGKKLSQRAAAFQVVALEQSVAARALAKHQVDV